MQETQHISGKDDLPRFNVRELDAGSSGQLQAAELSPDGRAVWVVRDEYLIDAGWVANQQLGHFILGITGLVTLAVLVWSARVWKRSRRRGGCPACGYDLSGQRGATVTCPECGKVAISRTRSRSNVVAWVAASACVAMLCLEAAVFPTRWWRLHSRVFPSSKYHSEMLEWVARSRKFDWLERCRIRLQVLTTKSLQHDISRRILPYLVGMHAGYNRAANALVVLRDDGAMLVSVEDGSIVSRVEGPHVDGLFGMERVAFMGDLEDEGERMYLHAHTGGPEQAQRACMELSWKAGTLRFAPGEAGKTPEDVRTFVIPGKGARFLQAPDFTTRRENEPYEVRLLDERGEEIVRKRVSEGLFDGHEPLFNRGGTRMYVQESVPTGQAIWVYDIPSLERVNTLTFGGKELQGVNVLSADERWLFAVGTGRVLVFDVERNRVVAALEFGDLPPTLRAIKVNDDGRVVLGVWEAAIGVWELPAELNTSPR